MLTAETSRLGFWIMSWASVMYSAKVESLPPSLRKCGKTSSRTTLSICVGRQVLEVLTSGGSARSAEVPLERLAQCAPPASRLVVSAMSSSRENIRNEICSMTVSGLVMPPARIRARACRSGCVSVSGNHADRRSLPFWRLEAIR